MSNSRFNLDLSIIQALLKNAGYTVKPGLALPLMMKSGLQANTSFVLPVEESGTEGLEISGVDVSGKYVEQFAVVGGFRSAGTNDGTRAIDPLLKWREDVKTLLIGAMVEGFEPITFSGGRMILTDKDTQNVFYQLQFGTEHTKVTDVRTVS